MKTINKSKFKKSLLELYCLKKKVTENKNQIMKLKSALKLIYLHTQEKKKVMLVNSKFDFKKEVTSVNKNFLVLHNFKDENFKVNVKLIVIFKTSPESNNISRLQAVFERKKRPLISFESWTPHNKHNKLSSTNNNYNFKFDEHDSTQQNVYYKLVKSVIK